MLVSESLQLVPCASFFDFFWVLGGFHAFDRQFLSLCSLFVFASPEVANKKGGSPEPETIIIDREVSSISVGTVGNLSHRL